VRKYAAPLANVSPLGYFLVSELPGRSPEATIPLVPRRIFFRNPDRTNVQLSSDGTHLAWTEPVGGIQNVFVAPADDPTRARQVTQETGRSISGYLWAYTHRHLVILRDSQGTEDYRCSSVDLDSGQELTLTGQAGVRSFVWRASRDYPTEMLFGVNERDRRYFDAIRIDVTTGAHRLVFENPGFSGLLMDDALTVRLAVRVRPDGSAEVVDLSRSDSPTLFLDIPPEDVFTTSVWRFSRDGHSLFLQNSCGRDRAALMERDLQTGETRLLAEDAEADIVGAWSDPRTGRPLAAVALASRQRWHVIDPIVREDIDFLSGRIGDAELNIVSQDLAMEQLVILAARSDAAGEYLLYNRRARDLRPLFKTRSDLDGVPLRPMQSVAIHARDGLTLPSYLTLPHDGFRNGPLVMVIHGGPYSRDVWGYNGMHQWLANRGYAVLSVNFRGSTGFGKAFIGAADQQWGGRMQDDLTDAATSVVAQGYADPTRIAFFGASYGGYAALVAATQTPETFACIVDIFGPSNLVTFMQAIPPYWQTWFALVRRRLADPETEEGRAWLMERSPITRVERIVRPLLIIQGMNDVRVKPQESEQIVNALRQRCIPVTYATFADEGHGFVREENRLAFSAVMEAFLARHLGGSVEPLGDAFKGSTIKFETGHELIPGLPG
jgi:dipeptidyl aminopeptidase/acylaminoacyl peptidase